MALRIFISFAKEDARYRTLLVGQAKNRGVPFEFADMSVQEPYDSKSKTRCREKIKQCDGFIALLSKKTWRADGARSEMNCAAEEGIPGIGIHIHEDDKGSIPSELRGRVINWHWDSITNFLNRVDSKRPYWDRLLS